MSIFAVSPQLYSGSVVMLSSVLDCFMHEIWKKLKSIGQLSRLGWCVIIRKNIFWKGGYYGEV